jgi:multidrug resistance efflux pump
MNEIDTNAYRRERNRLFNGLSKAKADLQAAKDTEKACQAEIENLEQQVVEAEANQVAYSDFVRRKSEFPEHLEV